MRKWFITSGLLISGLLVIGLLSLLQGWNITMAKENKVTYLAEFRSTEAHCNYQINGISIYSNTNRDVAMQLSMADRVGALLQEGENSISINGMDIPWDHTKAFCELTLKAVIPNAETEEVETKEITSLRLTYDENGKFTVKESKVYPDPSLTEAAQLFSLNKITYFKEEGMQNDVLASRIFEIRHPHSHHSWTHRSTPIENTPENVERVWQAYEAFRTAFAKKDLKTIKRLSEPGFSETEAYQGDPKTKRWTKSMLSIFSYAWEAEDFKVMPVNREDYELQIGAGGKLFRLVDKMSVDQMDSPIVY